ncbi:unnamed protein product, partial [marine sediment metagenome]
MDEMMSTAHDYWTHYVRDFDRAMQHSEPAQRLKHVACWGSSHVGLRAALLAA